MTPGPGADQSADRIFYGDPPLGPPVKSSPLKALRTEDATHALFLSRVYLCAPPTPSFSGTLSLNHTGAFPLSFPQASSLLSSTGPSFPLSLVSWAHAAQLAHFFHRSLILALWLSKYTLTCKRGKKKKLGKFFRKIFRKIIEPWLRFALIIFIVFLSSSY